MISVTHNMLAMNANRQYGIVLGGRQKSTEKLSSGYKINRAADDAAGLQISEKMRSQVRGLNQGSDNVQDGISLVQIADGALAEVNDMLHRMTELSVKSANGTNTTADRQAIQHEITQIISEIDRIHQSTEFNTMKLFDGNVAKLGGKQADIGPVKCKSTADGKMAETFSGKAAAIVDFSSVNSKNIGQLDGKYFSFDCPLGCGETFKFNFVNSGGSQFVTNTRTKHEYQIDISTLKSGSELVNEIYNTVENAYNIAATDYANGYVDPVTPGGSYYNGGFGNINSGAKTPGVPVGHYIGLAKDGADKLVIYSASSSKGGVDTKALVSPPVELGKMKPFWIQASGVPGDGLQIEVEKMNAEYIGISDVDVSTLEGARESIDKIVNAGDMISAMRSKLGAFQNRMEHTYANNENKAENTQAAESRIRDTDMATEMVQFTKSNILAQVGESMLAQANQSNQGVLSLLGG